MTYAAYGSVEASDYNVLIGADPSISAGKLNTVWGTGSSTAGYGQTPEAIVSIGNTVTAEKWANLVTKTSNAASHQGSSIISVTAPLVSGVITYLSSIPTNLNTIYSNRLNATIQGTSSANTATNGTSWSDKLIFTHTVTFNTGDQCRYFFNSGGQLAITCSHPSGTGINLLLNNLASNIGTVVMSAPTSGSATIAGTSYNGITKIGGGGSTPTIASNNGYYALTTANANVFYQTASTGPAYYLNTNINIFIKSNGTQGSNGDRGSVITIYTVWDEVPNGLTAGSGSTTTVTVRPPETTYLSNSWGPVTVAGTVTGS